jgi:hypothetical protein
MSGVVRLWLITPSDPIDLPRSDGDVLGRPSDASSPAWANSPPRPPSKAQCHRPTVSAPPQVSAATAYSASSL